MKMIVGLGNPGQKYVGSRHNVGFDVIAELANRYEVGRPKAKFNGEFAETIIKQEKVVLVCPLTFMNLSGQCVRAAVDFFKLDLDDLLIICDDFNLALGRIRIRPSGSAGGQNGLDDIVNRLGSRQIARLRLGIGNPPPEWEVANYVLGKFNEEDRQTIGTAVKRSADACETWVSQGVSAAMNQFNADPNQPAKKKKPEGDSATPGDEAESKQEKNVPDR